MNALIRTNTLIVDAYGFAFRSYHIQRALTYNGEPVGCLYGFTSMLMKVINDFNPIKAVVVFDHGGPNFRHELYDQYKQHRPPIPEELKVQLPKLRDAARALNFHVQELPGVEADDVIASLASKANQHGDRALIISSDKDLMQLINDRVWMFDPVKQSYIKEEEVVAKFGVTPSQMRDFLSMVGDAADNIPGIKGVGPKIASELLAKYGSLDMIYSNIDKILPERRRELLIASKDNAYMSLKLVTLKDDLLVPWDCFNWSPPVGEQIFSFLHQYGFKSLVPRAQSAFLLQPAQVYLKSEEDKERKITILPLTSDIAELTAAITSKGKVGIMLREQKWIISLEANAIYEFGRDSSADRAIMDVLRDPSVLKITYDLKSMMHVLDATADCFESCQDIMLMYYAISAGNKQLNLADIISKVCDISSNGYHLTNGYVCAFLVELYDKLLKQLLEHKALYLYHEIDLPLCKVLFEIEQEGFPVDPDKLKEISGVFSESIAEIEKRIYAAADKVFNIASPKQLGEVLFDHMSLPGGKKSGKSGNYATNNDILASLQIQGFDIASLIIHWRHLTKLKNTYTDALPTQISPVTGRLHTHFCQNATSTGRLSSLEPNLQNIPVKTKEGLLIRTAFVAHKGHKLISADYSQIELRILAEVAGVHAMKEAFLEGKDIHTITASQMFGVALDQVDKEMRRKAKAINFGIIYGISAYGLAQNLQIGTQVADSYIKHYFKQYPEIETYCDETKKSAYQHGFVRNLLGRKCFIPGINDPNYQARSFAQRAAINAPIQSLAADIIKIAMIRLQEKLRTTNSKAKVLLQVHDEIVVSCPEPELSSVAETMRSCMQDLPVSIPLTVEVRLGDNWAEMEVV